MQPTNELPKYAQLFIEGLKEAGVSVVCAVPESLLAGVYRGCARDNSLRYIPVTNEAELPGICAGTYLAGKKAIMVMENSGLRQACEPIARFSFCHAMPLVMAMSFRGEWGERNWWGHNHAQTMEPILNALRIPFRFIARLDEIKPAIKKAYFHSELEQLARRNGFHRRMCRGTCLCKELKPSRRWRPSSPRTTC